MCVVGLSFFFTVLTSYVTYRYMSLKTDILRQLSITHIVWNIQFIIHILAVIQAGSALTQEVRN